MPYVARDGNGSLYFYAQDELPRWSSEREGFFTNAFAGCAYLGGLDGELIEPIYPSVKRGECVKVIIELDKEEARNAKD